MNTQQDTRQLKGQEIAVRYRITQQENLWIVPSQAGKGKYKVDLKSSKCSCPDFENRKKKCKHLWAVEFTIDRQMLDAIDYKPTVEALAEIPKVKKPTYRQDWATYNPAQMAEKRQFQYLLAQLCKGIGEPSQKTGRPRIPLSDVLYTCAYKVYSTFSGRRFATDLKEAHGKGYISDYVHYNSMFRYMDTELLTAYLKLLIEESSLPLAIVEKDFAVDATGISGCRFFQWVDAKYSNPQLLNIRDWVKVHLICGVKTHIVTAVEITDRHAGDSPQFKGLVEATAANFYIEQVSADKAYSSEANMKAVIKANAMPYIAFRENATAKGHKKDSLWTKMFHFYAYNQERFFQNYHKRSNSETTFHMIKSKFGDSLRSKVERAQINEALCKVLCHNICVVNQSMFELGLKPKFWKEI